MALRNGTAEDKNRGAAGGLPGIGEELKLATKVENCLSMRASRMWWNWQTRYFEVVVPQGVQVQVLSCAPNFFQHPADFP
jgi:hypothetical protein